MLSLSKNLRTKIYRFKIRYEIFGYFINVIRDRFAFRLDSRSAFQKIRFAKKNG